MSRLMFKTKSQRVTISHDDRDVVESFMNHLQGLKLRKVAFSKLEQADDEWGFVVACRSAESLYYDVLRPEVAGFKDMDAGRIALEIGNDDPAVQRCPQEVLLSVAFTSGVPFGDDNDLSFIRSLRHDITHGTYGRPAGVDYYILGYGAMTMSVPCGNIESVAEQLRRAAQIYGSTKVVTEIIDRQQA